ncbi:MAG: selenocysteine-specific translation elongation factor, partial [Candidatus Tectomicrobia bacterium]|nr:selenocysteine-specific translation elongation factor [Candidatus Tectomicrobia bacterium]
MKQVVLGTAGHIDHGKTALVKALTGVDTDRLKEEKERGITIDLGFASLELPGGIRLGVVDVPGHERFVRNMLAGAGGIDLVMLVVAADEGVMPQTREHLAICRLLEVRDGIVALTKKDLVDEEWLELAADDVRTFLRGTFLEDKPIVPVSSRTGEGLEEIRAALQGCAARVPEKDADGPLRLPIDRVFTMRGFGVVVTGTLFSGRAHLEERVVLQPKGLTARVRGIQVHGQGLPEAAAGQRTAINLQGLEKETIERGDVLAAPDSVRPSYMLDVAIHYLPDAPRPLKNRDRIRFHQGTAEAIGRVAVVGADALPPGETGFAQLRLEAPVVVRPGDRYVIRSYSPITTIGGGKVLDSDPPKHRRLRPETAGRFAALLEADDRARAALFLKEAGHKGLALPELLPRTSASRKGLLDTLEGLRKDGTAEWVDAQAGWAVHRDALESLESEIREVLGKFHRENPLRPGVSKEELRSRVPGAPDKVFGFALRRLGGRDLVIEGDLVRLSSHKVSLGAAQSELREKIEQMYRKAGFQPPRIDEALQQLGIPRREDRAVIEVLVGEGALIRVKDDLLYHRESLEKVKETLAAHLAKNGEISAS